jgi:hypothetical protein
VTRRSGSPHRPVSAFVSVPESRPRMLPLTVTERRPEVTICVDDPSGLWAGSAVTSGAAAGHTPANIAGSCPLAKGARWPRRLRADPLRLP